MRTKFATKLRIKLCTGFYKKKACIPNIYEAGLSEDDGLKY